MKTKKFLSVLLLLSALLLIINVEVKSCMSFRIAAEDGCIIVGRTMEFRLDLDFNIVYIPRNYEIISYKSDNTESLKWKTKYCYVGVNSFNQFEALNEGMNEAGLAVSALWFEKNNKYQLVEKNDTPKSIGHAYLVSWLLGNFSNVEEVKNAIKNMTIYGDFIPELGFVPPFHYIVYDKKGGCIVIEVENGIKNIYDNPLGVFTNSPNFPWHITNLRQYIGISPNKLDEKKFSGIDFGTTGNGSGMFGLPGDFSPPSRFVRLVFFTQYAHKPKNAKAALNLALHITNDFDIFKGMITDSKPEGAGESADETTQWSTFKDLTNSIFYYRTYDNLDIRYIDLKELNPNDKSPRMFDFNEDEQIFYNMTRKLK
ncbi:MAG: choloylglycine hydrolase family protein [bacterium]